MRDIKLDLLDGPDWYKCGETVHERPEANASQARSHAYHVLLGNAGIDVLVRTALTELIEKCIAVVASQQQYLWIRNG